MACQLHCRMSAQLVSLRLATCLLPWRPAVPAAPQKVKAENSPSKERWTYEKISKAVDNIQGRLKSCASPEELNALMAEVGRALHTDGLACNNRGMSRGGSKGSNFCCEAHAPHGLSCHLAACVINQQEQTFFTLLCSSGSWWSSGQSSQR